MAKKTQCDCLKTSTANILDFVKKKFQEDGKQVAEYNEKDSGYVNRVFSFDSGGGYKLVMPFEVKYTPIKKNGDHGKEVTYKTSIFPTFCPFCGKKHS